MVVSVTLPSGTNFVRKLKKIGGKLSISPSLQATSPLILKTVFCGLNIDGGINENSTNRTCLHKSRPPCAHGDHTTRYMIE